MKIYYAKSQMWDNEFNVSGLFHKHISQKIVLYLKYNLL